MKASSGASNSKLFVLVPITFLIHVSEEWFFGFPEWAQSHFGPITTPSFFILSHIVLVFGVVVVTIAGYFSKPKGMGILLALVAHFTMVTNGLFHVATSFIF